MIHGRLVLRALLLLLLIVALFMAVPLLWVWIDGEVGTARAFLIPIALTVALTLPLLLLRRFELEDMSPRDGFLLVAVSWLGASALGAVPFVLSGALPNYADALFETMSGFTTTGASGNQAFGITSGTSGCDQDGVIKGEQMASMFLGDNLDKVARDASRGEGENLESLATLLGVERRHHADFYRATRQNFGAIFASENVTAGQVLASLKQVMAEDAVLRRYVQV